MKTKIANLLCMCLMCSALLSSKTLAETRTTPVEVQNSPTVEISSTSNLVTTQVKTLKVSPLTTTLTVAAGGSSYIPDVNCSGYKEARIMIYSNIPYTVAQDLTVLFYYDTVALGTLSWYDIPSTVSRMGFSPICTTFCATVPVMGNVLKVKITNSSGTAVTISPSLCWVYLVN